VQVEAAAESLTERYSDVVAVVIAIADQGGHWILSCAKPLAGMERAQTQNKAVQGCARLRDFGIWLSGSSLRCVARHPLIVAGLQATPRRSRREDACPDATAIGRCSKRSTAATESRRSVQQRLCT
jgi:hypothetical protein